MSESAQPAVSQPRVAIGALADFIARALAAVGVPPEDARAVSALMAESDARGADAHGVFRLPQYVKQIQQGAVNPRARIRVVEERAGAALLDGDNALGHLVMKRATEMAVDKAAKCGVGWAGTRHSNHAGPAQLYPRMAAARDAGVPVFAGTDAGTMVAHGRIADEVEALKGIGMSATEALGAACWDARRWLGRPALDSGPMLIVKLPSAFAGMSVLSSSPCVTGAAVVSAMSA